MYYKGGNFCENLFVFLFLHDVPFRNGITLKRKNLLPLGGSKFFLLRVTLFSEGSKCFLFRVGPFLEGMKAILAALTSLKVCQLPFMRTISTPSLPEGPTIIRKQQINRSAWPSGQSGQNRCFPLLESPNSIRKYAYSNILNFFTTKKGKFSDNNSDVFQFLAQNINCGYVLTSTHNLCCCFFFFFFFFQNKKNYIYTPVNPSFTYIKVGIKGFNII